MGNAPRYIVHRIRERLPELIPAFPARITRVGGFISYVMTYVRVTSHATKSAQESID